MILTLDGAEVGDTCAGTFGTWTGSPAYTFAWTRDGVDIVGASTRVYILVTNDVGAMIGYRVTATNAGGSASADAVPVGPVTEAAP